ncbi:MAG: DNA (cytosine-5-)-methyltransferase [Candidatus Omnitrophota bacterium]
MRRTNRDNVIRFKDLEKALAEHTETYGYLDLLCAGWPCQGNSQAGKRKGFACPQSGLWKEVKRLIGIFYPQWFIGENVPGLFSVNAGKDFWEVVSDLNSFGYCVAWDVLDSQNFGVAQRRKRLFIVASLGNIGAAKVLFEREGNTGNVAPAKTVGPRGLCILARDGERQNPTQETYIAYSCRSSDGSFPRNRENLIAYTIGAYDGRKNHPTTETHIASTIRANDYSCGHKGYEKSNLIAEVDSQRERKVTRAPRGLDSCRGKVIGNAVTVPVAEWIGRRIRKYGKNIY